MIKQDILMDFFRFVKHSGVINLRKKDWMNSNMKLICTNGQGF